MPVPFCKPGANLLAVRAENRPAPSSNPAGLIVRLAVTLADGKQLVVVSDGSWRADSELRSQWEQLAFDDASWKTAAVSAPFGGGPWGKVVGLGRDVQDDPVAAYAGESPAVKDLYFSVRRVKHSIVFKNPVLDFSQVLFIDQPLPQGPINPEHEAIHRMGITSVSRRSIVGTRSDCTRAASSANCRPTSPGASGGPICRLTPNACSSATSRMTSQVSICTR